MCNKIKFSHNYSKLMSQTSARLMWVFEFTKDESLNQDLFIAYDTLIEDTQEFYELKDGKYVVLLFLGNDGIPFTTIRPRKGRYGDKLEYYSGKIGEKFEIVIKEVKQ